MAQKAFWRFGCLLLITIVSSCVKFPESKDTASPIIPIISQSLTITSSLTPSSKTTPTNSPTTTALVTLSSEDAHKRLFELLANNGGCHLPCLWGITPGSSSYQYAQAILSPLNGISSIFDINPNFDPIGGFVLPSFDESTDDLFFNTGASYLTDNQIVSNINFFAREEKIPTDSNGNWISRQPIFDFQNFYKRIEFYSLSHVMSEQGMPASVLFHASGLSGYPVVAGGIEIALIYPDQGIWVNYSMPMYNLNGIKKGCPSNSHIEMELFPPGNPGYFFSQLDKTDWFYTKSGYRPLEEATSMSVKEFYETFRNPTDKCVETPANLWPPPEPGGG